MKRNFVAITLIALFFSIALTGCEKENVNPKSKSVSELAPELQDLYKQMPQRDYGKISVIGDGILKFESIQQYEKVCSLLSQDCELWDDLFLEKYSNVPEDSLEEIELNLHYNEYQPLVEFEKNHKIFGLMLRDEQEQEFELWLDNGLKGPMPTDSIFIDKVEQTLYNQYHEICIGDTIFQFRTDGYVRIPIDSVRDMSRYRKMPLSTLSDIFTVVTNSPKLSDEAVDLTKPWGGSFSISTLEMSYWTANGECNSIINGKHRPKLVSEITNLKYNVKRQKWVKTRRMCSITSKVQFYWEAYNEYGVMCNQDFTEEYTKDVTEKKRQSRTTRVKGEVTNLYVYYVWGIKKNTPELIRVNGTSYDTVLD